MKKLHISHITISSLESELQRSVNTICKKYKVSNISLKFVDKDLGKGPAFYTTIKSGDQHIPKNITMGEWNFIKKFPKEFIPVLFHELAHHIENVRYNSLRHNRGHEKLAYELEKEFFKFIKNEDEIERLRNKINYWENNKDTILEQYAEVGQKLNYEKELKNMKTKLQGLL